MPRRFNTIFLYYKEKQVDILWEKVIQSKNIEEEKEALQNLWSDFSYDRIRVSIFYKKEKMILKN